MFAFLSSSKLKENLTELHIIVRTTGYHLFLFYHKVQHNVDNYYVRYVCLNYSTGTFSKDFFSQGAVN